PWCRFVVDLSGGDSGIGVRVEEWQENGEKWGRNGWREKWFGALMSTQQYMENVVEDVGDDDDFKSAAWVSATNYVNAFGGTVKNKREKDKIRTKPDKNGKRGEAEKSQEQS
nr:hypothetical protein [Tanacetum cinerariifolium]